MTAEHAGEQVVTRIGFAERWLERAKGQVVAGNLTRGLLTLVLADAEVHHALEVAGSEHVRRPAVRPVLAPVALAMTALVAVAAMALATDRRSEPVATESAPPIVALSGPAGALLDLVSSVSPAPSVTAAARTPAPPAAGRRVRARTLAQERSAAPAMQQPIARPASVLVSAPTELGAGQPASSPAPAAAVPTVPSTVPQLTAGDLIDLVLAAERALRSDSTRR